MPDEAELVLALVAVWIGTAFAFLPEADETLTPLIHLCSRILAAVLLSSEPDRVYLILLLERVSPVHAHPTLGEN